MSILNDRLEARLDFPNIFHTGTTRHKLLIVQLSKLLLYRQFNLRGSTHLTLMLDIDNISVNKDSEINL